MRVLVVNAGSSSLKLSVLEDDDVRLAENLDSPCGRVDEDAVRAVIERGSPKTSRLRAAVWTRTPSVR